MTALPLDDPAPAVAARALTRRAARHGRVRRRRPARRLARFPAGQFTTVKAVRLRQVDADAPAGRARSATAGTVHIGP